MDDCAARVHATVISDAVPDQVVIDAGSLERLAVEIGTLRARIRLVHLATHLEQKALLTPHQVMTYDRLLLAVFCHLICNLLRFSTGRKRPKADIRCGA